MEGIVGNEEECSAVVECPPGIVGRVIGKGGETIKALQMQSGAHISIDQDFPEGVPRKITVRGSKERVDLGVRLVSELIRGGPGATAQVLAAVPGGTSQVLECPKEIIGKVIGRGGETIKRIQATSGARIQINQAEDPMRITVSGHQECVQYASAMVADIIAGGSGNVQAFSYGYQGYGYPPAYPVPYPHSYMYPSGYPYPQAYMYPGYEHYIQQRPATGPAMIPPRLAPHMTIPGTEKKGDEEATSTVRQVWFKMQDQEGKPYYYNAETGQSQWEAPRDIGT